MQLGEFGFTELQVVRPICIDSGEIGKDSFQSAHLAIFERTISKLQKAPFYRLKRVCSSGAKEIAQNAGIEKGDALHGRQDGQEIVDFRKVQAQSGKV